MAVSRGVILIGLLLANNIIEFAFGNFPCICSYQLETPVYKLEDRSSDILGYMYEFDCKPVYPIHGSGNSEFSAIQFEKQIGYISAPSGVLSIEGCNGTPPPVDVVINGALTDAITTTTTTTATTSTIPLTTETPTITTSTKATSPTTTSPPNSFPTRSPNSTTTSPSTTLPTTTPSTTTHPTHPTRTSTTTIHPTTNLPTTISTTTKHASNIPTTHQTNVCPPLWKHKHNSCYFVNFYHTLRRADAQFECSKKNGNAHLAFIESAQEQHSLAHYILSLPEYATLVRKNQSTILWLGGRLHNSEPRKWFWNVNNNSYSMHYTNWESGIHTPNKNHVCVILAPQQKFQWLQVLCVNRHYYICEIDLNKSPALVG